MDIELLFELVALTHLGCSIGFLAALIKTKINFLLHSPQTIASIIHVVAALFAMPSRRISTEKPYLGLARPASELQTC